MRRQSGDHLKFCQGATRIRKLLWQATYSAFFDRNVTLAFSGCTTRNLPNPSGRRSVRVSRLQVRFRQADRRIVALYGWPRYVLYIV